MKTKIALLTIAAFFILGCKINACYAQASPKLLTGKWKCDNFLAPRLEFNADSSAKLDTGNFTYFLKKRTLYLKDSKGRSSTYGVLKLTSDSLQLAFYMMGSTVKLDYYRVQ